MDYYIKESVQDKIHKHLYEKELTEESFEVLRYLHSTYTDYPTFYPERYRYPFRLKKDYFKPILKGESFAYLDLTTINKTSYSYDIFNEIIKDIGSRNSLFWHVYDEESFYETYPEELDQKKRLFDDKLFTSGADLAAYLELEITMEEILSNKLKRDYKVGLKRYGKGGKLTRVLSALTEIYRLHGIKDRYIGNLLPENALEGIYLSVHPFTGYLAGIISKSCICPEGCNKHTGVIYNGYYNAAMLHNADLTWRAFISIDFENKVFTVNRGYPREDYLMQHTVKKYFEELGFKFVYDYFAYPEYWDSNTLFTGERGNFQNKDGFYPYTKEDSITGIQGRDTIAEVYHSDYNDTFDFDPEHIHEGNDDYTWCDYEEEEHYYDSVYWSDYLDSYVSEYGESLFFDNNNEMIYETYVRAVAKTISEELAAKITENDVDRLGIAYDILRETYDYIGEVTFHVLTKYEKEMSREDKLEEARRVETTFFDILPDYS